MAKVTCKRKLQKVRTHDGGVKEEILDLDLQSQVAGMGEQTWHEPLKPQSQPLMRHLFQQGHAS